MVGKFSFLFLLWDVLKNYVYSLKYEISYTLMAFFFYFFITIPKKLQFLLLIFISQTYWERMNLKVRNLVETNQ
jgi:hypothetical protein